MSVRSNLKEWLDTKIGHFTVVIVLGCCAFLLLAGGISISNAVFSWDNATTKSNAITVHGVQYRDLGTQMADVTGEPVVLGPNLATVPVRLQNGADTALLYTAPSLPTVGSCVIFRRWEVTKNVPMHYMECVEKVLPGPCTYSN